MLFSNLNSLLSSGLFLAGVETNKKLQSEIMRSMGNGHPLYQFFSISVFFFFFSISDISLLFYEGSSAEERVM